MAMEYGCSVAFDCLFAQSTKQTNITTLKPNTSTHTKDKPSRNGLSHIVTRSPHSTSQSFKTKKLHIIY